MRPFDMIRVLLKGSFISRIYRYGQDWEIKIKIDGVFVQLPYYFENPVSLLNIFTLAEIWE